MPLTLRLFGPLQVLLQDGPMPRVRTRSVEWLLALLVLRAGRSVSRSWLAGTLWPDSDEAQALQNLRNALLALRKALGSEGARIQSPSRDTLRLDLDGADVDLLRFDGAIRRGGEEALREAVELCTGSLLEGCHEEWVVAEREGRQQACLTALETLAEAAERRADHAGALALLRRAEGIDPLRDTIQRGLMRLLTATGDTPAALFVYRDYRLRLHREMHMEPDAETTRLFHEIREPGRQPAPSRPAPPVPAASLRVSPAECPTEPSASPSGDDPAPLPHPLTALIGREQAVREVAASLSVSRLVTLVGGGGIGKTRLAIQVAAETASRFADGTSFVALASLSDPALLPAFVASALGVREEATLEPEFLLRALTGWLCPRSILLVLDNCEHLVAATAALSRALLERCPRLHILATSRQRLGLIGEVAWRVPSLPCPTPELFDVTAGPVAEAVLDYPAVQLFVERAAMARPELNLVGKGDAVAVARICHRLDGIPLAIELAAARVRSLSIEEINARLDQRFQFLTGGHGTVLPRHRTLRSLIDWSYDLLDEAERTLLRRLSVFAGGWTLDAAEAVCSGAGIPEDILDLLTSLVDKSLVIYAEPRGQARYQSLETVRQYAHGRLVEAGEVAAVRGRHRRYFTRFAEEARRRLNGSQQLAWSHRLEIEHDNLRSAIAWCREDPEGVEAGLRLTGVMGWFWATHGYLSEGRQHLAEALARDGPSRTSARADALNYAGLLACPDYTAAQSLYEECLAIRRELGDRPGMAEILTALGLIKREQGDHATAISYLEESLAIRQEVGVRQGSASTLYWLGCIAEAQGDLDKAHLLLQEAYAIDREYGNRAGSAQWTLGDVLCMQGEYGPARALLIESLTTARELGDKVLAIAALACLAWLAHSQGESERAARLYGASYAVRTAIGYVFAPSDQNKHEARTATVRAALGDEAAFQKAWADGQALSLEQAVECALA